MVRRSPVIQVFPLQDRPVVHGPCLRLPITGRTARYSRISKNQRTRISCCLLKVVRSILDYIHPTIFAESVKNILDVNIHSGRGGHKRPVGKAGGSPELLKVVSEIEIELQNHNARVQTFAFSPG